MKHVPMLIGWETYLIFASSSERKVGLLRRVGGASILKAQRQGWVFLLRREERDILRQHTCVTSQEPSFHIYLQKQEGLSSFLQEILLLLLRRARRRLVLQMTCLVLESKSARPPSLVKEMELTFSIE